MTITILPESVGKDGVTYRAICGALQSEGKTAGEALDALAEQLNEDEAGTLVIVQNLRPDRFFTAQQEERLGELMTRWRSARDANDVLPAEEESELEQLIEAELKAATSRAGAMSHELKQQAQAGQTDLVEEVEQEEGHLEEVWRENPFGLIIAQMSKNLNPAPVMEWVFCEHCGEKIGADDVVCAHCGSRQPTPGSVAAAGGRVRPVNHTPLEAYQTDATQMPDRGRKRGGGAAKHERVDSDAPDKKA